MWLTTPMLFSSIGSTKLVVASIACLPNIKPCWIVVCCFTIKKIVPSWWRYTFDFSIIHLTIFQLFIVFRIPSWLDFNSSIVFCISSWLVSINYCISNWLASIVSKRTSSSSINPLFPDLPSFGIQPSYTIDQITTHYAQHYGKKTPCL